MDLNELLIKKEKVRNLRPIDDVFFEVLAKNKEVDEEILRTILEDPDLIVVDSIVQSSERNLFGRSVRLDALCELGDGTLCNIEVQRSDNDNHLKRARYNASAITFKKSNPGEKFDDVREVYIVYISEFDVFHEGKTIYHIEKVISETGTAVDDGLHEIFVNAAIDDKSDIAELMSCFIKKEVNNKKFPKLSKEVYELKNTKGGLKAMCSVMEELIAEERISAIQNMLKENLSKELIKRLKYSEEEIQKAEEALLLKV